jgi:outer membrane protein OmpA-like peptidoglycan-associated protein
MIRAALVLLVSAVGAGGGAGAGALIGGLAGGWKRAAVGAGARALAGGAIGNHMDKQANELKQVADAKRTQEGILINLKNDLTFDTGKSDLKPSAQVQLSQMGDIMAKYTDDRIRIEGFTDSTGGESFNQLLSQQRAQTVSNALVVRGVKPQQLIATGMGEGQPIASNSTGVGRSKKRRVELFTKCSL